MRWNAMKRVAAGAHLPIPWTLEPEKRPDDRADYISRMGQVLKNANGEDACCASPYGRYERNETFGSIST